MRRPMAVRSLFAPHATLLAALAAIGASSADASAQALTTTRIANGLARPVQVTHAPGDYSRVFIVEQRSGTTGRIRIVDMPGDTLRATPFLSVTGVTTDNEQGLLGLAFHPNYANNGYFYVYYTRAGGTMAGGQSTIVRYTRSAADPNLADAASAMTVMVIDQPQSNHNGGWLAFGPDGYLYLSLGDGGNGGDTGTGHNATIGNAQDINSNLGKIIRIDVNGDDFPADPNRNYSIPPSNPFAGAIPGNDEIWLYGLRNPWRNCFDRATGALYIADVGQDLWEEINFLAPNNPASMPGQAGYMGGKNFGWRCYEGNATYNTSNCPGSGSMVFPFLIYGHTSSVPPTNATGCSITGGNIYRGCAMPALAGTYFFSDACSNKIFSFRANGAGGYSEFTDRTVELDPPGASTITSVVSFGEDAFGEIYICELGGEVWRIIPAASNTDCNANGRADICEIAAGLVRDANHDNIPDSCHCPADWDGNNSFDPSDIAQFVNAWLASLQGSNTWADFDGNGTVEPADLAAFVNSWLAALSGGC